MLSLAMGFRQSLGLFMPALTRDIGITVSDFTLAIAVQNLAWGFLQPVAGGLASRWGFRPVMTVGALLYVAGLLVLAAAHGLVAVTLGAGILIGASLACTASALAMSVASRAVSVELRSTVLGIVSAAGSLGSLLAAPVGQVLLEGFGWRAGVAGFAVLSLAMLPAAWVAGRVDRVALPPAGRPAAPSAALAAAPVAAPTAASPVPSAIPGTDGRRGGDALGARAALGLALGNPAFIVMSLAYFVCGMQLVFLTTHLPSYLQLCGMDPMLSAKALGVIGGFNVLGSLFFGWAGGRWNKQVLLGAIYLLRSLTLAVYFTAAPTPAGTLVFAAVMGFLWLGVAPLIAGSVAEMFGLRWQAMIQGVAFMSHQFGSFLGAFGGGVVFDRLGSYTLALAVGIALGLLAGVAQIAFALARPSGPPAVALAR
nr:MFS transporter [Roseomonas acroporae]